MFDNCPQNTGILLKNASDKVVQLVWKVKDGQTVTDCTCRKVSNPYDILRKHWGYDSFRGVQAEVIQAAMTRKDALVLMPTGGGKSLCYQVPAMCNPGLVLVISPLIALMKDQVDQLMQRKIQAIYIHSGMNLPTIDRELDRAAYGSIKLLFVSPERLKTELFQVRLAKMKVSLLAVDEAHCISQWGYDFRPAYQEIAEIRKIIPDVPVMALTATATDKVRKDIVQFLELKEPKVFVSSFLRKELSYSVLQESDKMRKMVDILSRVKGSTVIYSRSRKNTEALADFLKKRGFSSSAYHAGLSHDLRNQRQKEWMQNKSRIMVSTNAFGMGIDKPDVRLVVHLDLPESLEEYYQEAGRAGRDGKRAYAVLLFQEADAINLLERFEKSTPDTAFIREVYRALANFFQIAVGQGEFQVFRFDIVEFARRFKFPATKTYHALRELEQEELIVLSSSLHDPSKVKFRVGRDRLYEFSREQPKFEELIKVLLRTYGGIIDDYSKVYENRLAKYLELSEKQVVVLLKQLHQYELLNYHERSNLPSLTYLKERLSDDNLNLNEKRIDVRRKQRKRNIESMIAYAKNPDACRQKVVLEYFGEILHEDCGCCDHCYGRHDKNLSQEKKMDATERIKKLLSEKDHKLEEIVDSFPSSKKDKIISLLRELLDEGILHLDGSNHIRWKS